MNVSKLVAVSLLVGSLSSAADYTLHSFKKIQLTDKFWSEGATFADLNRDGHNDIISGPYWWEGPDFKKRHEFYPATETFKRKNADGAEITIEGFEGGLGVNNKYSDNFFAFTYDFNGDGWLDILIYGFPGKDASWFENPGKAGINGPGHWKRHVVFETVDNESPTWADLLGTGKPVIVCNSGGYFGYVQPDWKNLAAKWTFHPISPKGNWQKFTHGLGVGDLNGDGRLDIMEAGGWWEQPASLAGDPEWKRHRYPFAAAGSQMYAYDVNGDGLADVITAVAAHGFGLVWHEQLKERGASGEIQFRSHTIMNKEPNENRYGLKFAQLHAVDLVDMDGDGIKDIVTGKRFWAHGPKGDIEANADPVTYFFKIVHNADKSVDFVPHLIASDVGVGVQVVAGDINGDKLPDVVIGNKKGTFVLMHETKKVSKEEWEKAQPKVLFPDAGLAALTPDKVIVHTNPERAAAQKAPAATGALPPDGVLPLGRDGKPLNLDFETGTLKDWTAEGPAFEGQPVKGEIDQNRPFGSGKRAGHHGQHWIGGYEIKKDQPKGTLTSAPFKVTHPWAAFLLGGGAHAGTRAELVRQDTGEVFFKSSAWSSETMRPVVVDLQQHFGKEIFIRLVDEVTVGWGHVNFDDFRFYAKKPLLAAAPAPKAGIAKGKAAPPEANLPPVDEFKFAGLKPEGATREMTLPPGFKAHLFAGEPDVRNPIAFCLDDRGRVWVVEGMTYPQRAPDGQGRDRILVFEDTNGDHKFDKRTVFMEGLNLVSGIEYGFGGVWVGAAPYLYFIPIADGDSPKPAGKPQVVLEGWGYQDTHETLNTFRWGPDGWLYGCHGVFTHSHVKPAGAPDTERQFINAGIWRYHPTKKKFEVFAEGTSNPWGMDFDERGQIIMEGCVIPHLWHMIQGARYHRQGGQHYLPSHDEIQRNDPDYFKQDFGAGRPRAPLAQFVYDDIKTIADHAHYAGKTPHGGNSRSSSMGGGHAHAGLMVYLGGSWPEQYRGKVFMNNIHGGRMNMDIPERAGSGFVGHHGADFLIANDKASQMMDMRYDQDGSVYVIDWYDLNQCHRPDRAVHDYDTGRIFKIVYNDTKATKVDLQKASDADLMDTAMGRNEWMSQHARRTLQERFSKYFPDLHSDSEVSDSGLHQAATALEALAKKTSGGWDNAKSTTSRLRILWTSYSTLGLVAKDDVKTVLNNQDEYVRAWGVQLSCEDHYSGWARRKFDVGPPKDDPFAAFLLSEFAHLARTDKSPVVRLYLASAAQRLPVEQRWDILAGLISHAEEAEDHNLPLMAWYAGEPLVAADVNRALDLALNAKLPNYLAYSARRAASLGTQDAMSALVKALGHATDDSKQLAILRGLGDALRGQRTAAAPAGWDAVASKLSSKPALRAEVNSLSAKFGSASALVALRETLHDPKADAAARAGALDALLNSKDPSLAPSLQRLLGDEALRGQAVRALANYDDAQTPSLVLAAYPSFAPAEKRDALATLASRPSFARVLVGALEQKTLATRDLTAETVRQIRSLNQQDINAKLDEFWGTMRETAADKLKEIERYRSIYIAGYSTPGDAGRGRVLYNITCGQCHTLFEVGGKVGPDLTGSNRRDLEYLLHNIIDPNAEIPNDYRASTVEMKDERSIMGIIKQQDDRSVTVLTATETSTLPRNEIKSIRQSEISMMPEGLLTALTDQEVRDLIFYLRSPAQVPLPVGAN